MGDKIVVEHLGKSFWRFHADRPRTLQEAVLAGMRRMRRTERVQALHDVTFRIADGEMVGVIGQNGAGKSTLLRLVGGIGKPDEGRIQLHGRIGALLSLGAGFHDDLTGRENTFINGVISGLTVAEVKKHFDSIVSFAELEDAIDSPLRTYSSGMQMRLGFAIATHIDPEILLIDEVLAVGDVVFQEKCIRRIREFKERRCTVLIVSHDSAFVREHCDTALWLHRGRVMGHGPADAVVHQYLEAMGQEGPADAGDHRAGRSGR
jgi:lipopolysaccharide transport system ATP-binding protein